MKKLILVIGLALATIQQGYSQASVVFNNRDTVNGVDARILDVGGLAGANSTIVAQLWAAAPGGSLQPIGAAVALRDTPASGLGYINATGQDLNRVVTGVAGGAPLDVQMRAWSIADGATYLAASAVPGARIGSSAILSLAATGGGGSPAGTPVPLVGLQGFTLTVVPVPEPSVVALAVAGVALLIARRRKA
jgi:hypothetical protein